MALGDLSSKIGFTGTLSVSVTYVCCACATGNVAPLVSQPVNQTVGGHMFQRVACANCGAAHLVSVTQGIVQAQAQQVSEPGVTT